MKKDQKIAKPKQPKSQSKPSKFKWCQECSGHAKQIAAKHQQEKQRLLSEMDNAQKRFTQTLINHKKYQNYDLLFELLESYDVLELALQFKVINTETKKFLIGVKMAHERLTKLLEAYAVKKIEVKVGDEFNPEFHEAIATETIADKSENQILKIVKNGYQLHDRLLRPTQVIVNQKHEINEENIKGEK